MKLPIEISPSPLITTTIEIRYVSTLESSQIFPLVYSAFMSELPNVEQNKLPLQLRQMEKNLKYVPDYILSNESYKLSFSGCVLSFENTGDYKLWGSYFPFVSKCFETFFKLIDIHFFERIGVRYGSVLDKTEGINQVLNFVPSIGVEGYNQKFESYRSNLEIDNVNLLLQIKDNANLVNTKKGSISGLYIDIDASILNKMNPDEDILKLIDKLHFEQKRLFFSLLKSEYIKTLNPKY